MPQYKVVLSGNVWLEFEVEAKSREGAEDLARGKFDDEIFFLDGSVHNIEVEEVEEIEEVA